MARPGSWYVVDTDALSDEERARACRVVLQSVRPAVVTGECDIPWDNRDNWSTEVSAAAERLRDRLIPDERRRDDYLQTGVRDLRDDDLWTDFVCFVPESLDATVWGSGGALIQVSDQAASVAVHADAALLGVLQAQLAPAQLVPARPTLAERIGRALRRVTRAP